MRTIFMGCGEYARDLLENMVGAGLAPLAVVTNPDRPSGRGLRPQPTPVGAFAAEAGLRVFRVDGPKDPVFSRIYLESQPEVVLVCDYGHIIPAELLSSFPGRFLNVHPSLLPRYRGAAPIRRALLEGAEKTGVSLMIVDEGLDTGPVVGYVEAAVLPDDDAESLRRRLARLGVELLKSVLPAYLSGTVRPQIQEEALATYAPPLRKDDLLIDWNRTAFSIHNQVRALAPAPGARGRLDGKWIKILRTLPLDGFEELGPGELGSPDRKRMVVGTGEGALEILILQPEGRKRMSGEEFLRGYRKKGRAGFETVVHREQ